MAERDGGAIARLRCLCGHVHDLTREHALDGAGWAVWRCSDCLRHFVVAHEGAGSGGRESFFPIYMESLPPYAVVRHTRASELPARGRTPDPPPALWFRCRCGREVQCHSFQYGKTCRCPGCAASVVPVLRFDRLLGEHVVKPEYAGRAVSRGAEVGGSP